MRIKSGLDVIELCKKENISVSELALRYETLQNDVSPTIIKERLLNYWQVMKNAIEVGLDESNKNIKGKIIGREAIKLKSRWKDETSICGPLMSKAVAYALSTMEVNISMGKIVAAPTAGASGVLPGVLKAMQEKFNLDDDTILRGLLTSSLIGVIIAKNASISGAKGGCQAEIGSASAMAAGAVVEMFDGDASQVFAAAASALKNLMGLICDPVAGLVEVPCHKRNAIGTSNALISAEMTLSGITNIIPFDETVEAMKNVGDLMPSCFRETATGGIAITKTAQALQRDIFK